MPDNGKGKSRPRRDKAPASGAESRRGQEDEAIDILAVMDHGDGEAPVDVHAPPVQDGPSWRELPLREKLNPRRITAPLPVYPLAILFGFNLVDELDRSAFAVLTPEIKDAFNLDLQGVLTVAAVIVPIGLILELPIGYFADRRRRV